MDRMVAKARDLCMDTPPEQNVTSKRCQWWLVECIGCTVTCGVLHHTCTSEGIPQDWKQTAAGTPHNLIIDSSKSVTLGTGMHQQVQRDRASWYARVTCSELRSLEHPPCLALRSFWPF